MFTERTFMRVAITARVDPVTSGRDSPVVVAAILGALLFAQSPDKELSAFERAKAEWFLTERLPCLGCHELDGEGGQIGPSLSGLKQSRTPEYVMAMIENPKQTLPGTIMPRIPMSRETRNLIVSYLTQREAGSRRNEVRRPRESGRGASVSGNDEPDAATTYSRFCAACHGEGGRGDGYNARFLPVRPTAHADSAYMSRRPDDVLFDAVSAGGYVMNRSPRMPPFGQTLTRTQIRQLVRYMRGLCGCTGPSWSRDGQ